jgi:hypothetical protein
MHHKEPMSARDITLVKVFARRGLKWALQCFFGGAFFGAGFGLFSYLGDASEYWILLVLAFAVAAVGAWSLRKWTRMRRDLRLQVKEVWTTSDFQPLHYETDGSRSGRLQQYQLTVDGERFAVFHDHLDVLGWDELTENRPTRVEVAPLSRVFLFCSQD